MNKELTPLEALENIRNLFIGSSIDLSHIFNIIENELKEKQERIEELELTNHLMALREHKNTKKLKALEIIKEKCVDIGWFMECLSCGNPLEVYNDRYDKTRSCDGKDYRFMQLTQEEYDLLKEVLM